MSVYKRGNRWYVYVTFPNRSRYRKSFPNKKAADQRERRIKTDIDRGRWEAYLIKDILFCDLVPEYLSYAKDAFRESKLRLSIDSGYNACELLVKALIISTKNPLASSHGGVIGQFGKLFVLTKKVSVDLGRNLNLGLDLRAKARYRPRAQLQAKDTEFIINLAQELLLVAKKELSRR